MKEIKMTFIEISRLYNAVNQASVIKFHAKPKFRYALARNRDILEVFMKQLREISKLPDDDDSIVAYEKARIELIKEYDKTGRLVPEEQIEEFREKLEELQETGHKEAWEKIESFNESVIEFQKEEQDVGLYMVDMELLPEDLTDQAAINNLFPILVDNSEESGQ